MPLRVVKFVAELDRVTSEESTGVSLVVGGDVDGVKLRDAIKEVVVVAERVRKVFDALVAAESEDVADAALVTVVESLRVALCGNVRVTL